MPSDNLDDLFRQQLEGHATPPGPGLQQRLAELAEAERLDTLFRTGLGSHASQPRRAVWERLEDEHLHPQPRRRRVVGWSHYSAAAVLLLLLLAGGARLWYGHYLGQPGRPVAAGQPAGTPQSGAAGAAQSTPTASKQLAPGSAKDQLTASQTIASTLATALTAASKKNQKNVFGQATAPVLSPSSHPIATTTRPRRPAPVPQAASSFHRSSRQPDAAAGQLASTGGLKTPAGQSPTTTPQAAATVAPAPHEAQPQPLTDVATTTPPAPAGIIEVEVRRGGGPARPAAAPALVAAASPAPTRRPRLRLGGLLRQADHLVHGESVSLAEATGLPESLTVQARLGGRTLSRTIQL